MSSRCTDTIAIKKLMVENGVEQVKVLAEITGVSRNTLGKVLKGKAQPSADVMERLIDALRIPHSQAGTIFFSENLRNE